MINVFEFVDDFGGPAVAASARARRPAIPFR
jgi:hypothetical protein